MSVTDGIPTLTKLADDVREHAKANVELFRGKQSVRDMLRTLADDLNRRLDNIEKRLDGIERSV